MMASSSSSSSSLYVVIMVLSLVWVVSSQASFDCVPTSALNSYIPRFTSLSVFPAQVMVGQQVHIRTVVNIPASTGLQKGNITGGLISMNVQFRDNQQTAFTISGIPLCNSTDYIDCSTLGPGDNNLQFDYLIPTIPAGEYQITLYFSQFVTSDNSQISSACLQIIVTVIDPSAPTDAFKSWLTAQLSGVSQFEHDDYLERTLDEYVQVGPIGQVDPNFAYSFPWGTFTAIQGSQDLINPYFAPAGYVWGLTGNMVQIIYQNVSRQQTYAGHFYVGYVSSLSKRSLDLSILTGTFTLTWFITTDSGGVVRSTLSGNLSFDDVAELPAGFSNPITVGRLGMMQVYTDSQGILQLTGAENVCMDNPNCNAVGASKKNGDKITGWQIGLIVGVLVGVMLVFLLVIALFKWHRRTQRHEAEDGIFAARRKPEYGNALVVDDIIQETREHSPNLMPPVYVRDAADLSSDSDSDDDFSRSRSRSRTPSRSRSPSPYSERRSKSPARSRSRSASRSYDSDDDSDAGSSASRA